MQVALCAAGGGLVSQRGGCTETRPLTQDLRAAPCRPYQPLDPVGWLRGARRPDHSLHRPLARRPGWRLVPACGNQEVEARRSADAQASSGSCCVKALHRSHLEAGDMTGASRPRAKSIPVAPMPGVGAARGGKQGFRLKRRTGPPWGTPPAVRRAAPQNLSLPPRPLVQPSVRAKRGSRQSFRGGVGGGLD